MPTLTLTGSHGTHSIEATSETTLLDLRYQLFSLTDIPPQTLYLTHNSTVYAPSDDEDGTRTLSVLNIPLHATLSYSDTPPSAKSAIQTSDVQAALNALSLRKTKSKEVTNIIERVQIYYDSVLKYEDPELQKKALAVTPVERLKNQAKEQHEKNGEQYPTYERALAKEVMHWFKTEFFTWMNQPECWACNKSKTKAVGMTDATESELKYGANRVELYICDNCGANTRFPRYNAVEKLLETRRGRCGEWAQAFALIMRSLGFVIRVVHDWTDHVWIEAWMEGWIHMDACEDVMDEALLYEGGWGKKLTFCIATGLGVIMDVSRRYTRKWEEVKERRGIDEGELENELKRMNERVMGDCREAKERWEWDKRDLERAKEEGKELGGRTSGNKEWVKARGEDGSKE